MKPFFKLFFIAFCLPILANAQGNIIGTVYDETSGEPLIGVNIIIDGTVQGMVTDLDGRYKISNVKAGTYTLVFSYISYVTQKVEDVVVMDKQNTEISLNLKEEAQVLEQIVISARKINNTENALLSLQKTAPAISDGISSQQIQKIGSSNAAQSMSFTTGASVVDGKYVYMRGLGDRYSNTQLNGSNIPSNDPYRNSFQLDIIPSFMIDNIVSQKAFTPDQPGNFTGGNVNIKTKEYPESFYAKLTLTTGFNNQSSFNKDFLSHEGGKTDWLGYADATREIPAFMQTAEVQSLLSGKYDAAARFNDNLAYTADQAVRALNNSMTPFQKSTSLNHSISFSTGNNVAIGKLPLGYNFGIRYSKNYAYDDRAQNNAYEPAVGGEDLPILQHFDNIRSVETPQVGALADINLKITPNNQISFNALYNHITEKNTEYLIGQNLGSATASEYTESRVMQFTERSFLFTQLRGKHIAAAKSARPVSIEWAANTVFLSQDEPDTRFFANKLSMDENGVKSNYRLDVNEISRPAHFFRYLNDFKHEEKIDVSLPIDVQEKYKLKIGLNYSDKQRDFSETQWGYDRYDVPASQGGSLSYNNNAEQYFGENNIGIVTDTTINDKNLHILGVYTRFDTKPEYSYEGNESMFAAYAMATLALSKRLEIIAGARFEKNDIFIAPSLVDYWNIAGQKIDNAEINATNILPAVNLKYSLSDKANLRAAFTQTIAKPNMREMAPFLSFDFIGGGFRYLGNPFLNFSTITNYDLRLETFPQAGELIALSVFYKHFDQPIVRQFSTISNPTEISWYNLDEGELYGAELEFRKNLGILGSFLDNFSINTNFSYIVSKLPVPEDEFAILQSIDPTAKNYRPFQGQSPFLFNFMLDYRSAKTGIQSNLNLNIFGKRLYVVGATGLPDVYEKPFPSLNYNVSKSFKGKFDVSFTIQNILNRYNQTVQTYREKDFLVSSSYPGRTFKLAFTFNLE